MTEVPITGSAPAPTARSTGRTRLTGKERKRQILEVSISLFGRRGYRGTTTKALADAAAVSEATIFKHFPTKEALYRAAFQHRTESGTAELIIELGRLADARDDRSLLRTLFDRVREGYTRDRDLHRMMQFALLEGEAEENRRIGSELAGALSHFVGCWVARRQEEGVFAPGPIEILVPALFAPIVQSLTWSKLYDVEPQHDDDTAVELLVDLVLRGLRQPHRLDADSSQ